jgi:serine/threonine protein kinase
LEGYEVCLKLFEPASQAQKEEVKLFEAEYNNSRNLDYPLVVDTYDMFEWNGHHFIMMEYVEGSTLLDYCNSWGHVPLETLRVIFSELVVTLDHLRRCGVIHRDLKCENIMLDKNLNVRVIDFGFARELITKDALCSTQCGSPAYMAPEIILNQPYDFSADIWSLGCIFYAGVTGNLPFYDENVSQQLRNALEKEPVFPPTMPPSLVDLISGMLRKDPCCRFTIDQIRSHPWLITDPSGEITGLYDDYLEDHIIRSNEGTPLDSEILARIGYTDEESSLRRALRSNIRNRDVLRYRIFKKQAVTEELVNLKKYLFASAPIQRLSLPNPGKFQTPARRLSMIAQSRLRLKNSSATNVAPPGTPLTKTMTGVVASNPALKTRPIPMLICGPKRARRSSPAPTMITRRHRVSSFDPLTALDADNDQEL